jgi:acyl-CoA synthetase (AMP-forming)/AMP-acid ligase II
MFLDEPQVRIVQDFCSPLSRGLRACRCAPARARASRTMNLAHLLARTARVFPAAPAVALGERELWSYGELFRRAAAIAGSCCAAATACRRVTASPCAWPIARSTSNCSTAIWHAGLVAVPINHKLHPREVAFILEIRRRRCSSSPAIRVGRDRHSAMGAHVPRLRIVAIDFAEYTGASPTANRSTSLRARPTTWPGCSTPREPPAGRRG